MIHTIYLEQCISAYDSPSMGGRDIGGKVAKAIHLLPEGDAVVAIHTITQEPRFNQYVEKQGLKDLIAFQTPYYFTNGSHMQSGRRLKIVVFSKTPIKESEYATGAFITGQA